jgi:hypothetical protein
LSKVEAKIVVAEFAAAGAEFGSSEMKREVLPKFLSGEWNDGCRQLISFRLPLTPCTAERGALVWVRSG